MCEMYVEQEGIFGLPECDSRERSRLLNTRCPEALYQRVRDITHALVDSGTLILFQMPNIDFNALYFDRERRERGAAPLSRLQRFGKVLGRVRALGSRSSHIADFHAFYQKALALSQLSRATLPAADQVLAQAPNDLNVLELLATVYTMNEAHGRATEVYRRMVSVSPRDARSHYNLATSLVFVGDLAGAARELDACLALQPTFWDAYTVRYTLPVKVRQERAPRARVGELLDLLRRYGSSPLARERLNMALGMEYEGQGDYAHAFAHFADGNATGKARRRYDIRQDGSLFGALMQYAPTSQTHASDCNAPAPIFVFGLPRSGTTLVDRILSMHPGVTSIGESKQFSLLLKSSSGSHTKNLIDVDTIARCQSLDWSNLGEHYVDHTCSRSEHVSHFVDKFPHNFMYTGYIAKALPHAKLICVRRNPMDVCLANFRQVFSEASPFHGYSFDILDNGRYYTMFDALMTFWRRCMPGRILEVSYESLVLNQEAETRTILGFCGLDWAPECLCFENNPAPVSTTSAAQVRSPLYTTAISRWKHYESQLRPLRKLLTESGITITGASAVDRPDYP